MLEINNLNQLEPFKGKYSNSESFLLFRNVSIIGLTTEEKGFIDFDEYVRLSLDPSLETGVSDFVKNFIKPKVTPNINPHFIYIPLNNQPLDTEESGTINGLKTQNLCYDISKKAQFKFVGYDAADFKSFDIDVADFFELFDSATINKNPIFRLLCSGSSTQIFSSVRFNRRNPF